MPIRPRAVLLIAVTTAIVVFCVVQDRVTADGARQYAELQRAAAAGHGDPVTLDEIMRPAVRRSVQQASAWGAVVIGAGIIAAGVLRSRSGGDA
jgi:hypothetical protein